MRTHVVRDKASLSGIRRAIRSDLSAAGVDASLSFDCLVAVTEAATNALNHGAEGGVDADPAPRISWLLEPGTVRFTIEDYSMQQWSMASHPSARSIVETSDYEERIGGFGLAIMRNLMDDVDISIGPDGTTVSMLKRFE